MKEAWTLGVILAINLYAILQFVFSLHQLQTKLGLLFSTAPYKIQQTQAWFETVQIASLIN